MKKITFPLLFFFLTTALQAQELMWVRSTGGTDQGEIGYSVKLDSQGNVYVAGNYRGEVNFDPGNDDNIFASMENGDAFLQKLDAEGNLLWVKVFNSGYFLERPSLAIDGNDGIYFSSSFNDEIDLDPGPEEDVHLSTGWGANTYIVKLNTAGEYIWGKSFDKSENSIFDVTVMCTDSDNNLILAGNIQETVDLDPNDGEFEIAAPSFSGFMLKLTGDGNFVWGRHFAGALYGFTYFTALDVDNDNNIITAGAFTGNVDMDPGEETLQFTSPDINNNDLFILKMNPEGNLVWAKKAEGYEDETADTGYNERITSIFIDDNDEILFTGFFRNYINLEPGNQDFVFDSGIVECANCAGFGTHILGRYNKDGDVVWAKMLEGEDNYSTFNSNAESHTMGNIVTLDEQGNMYLGISFLGNFDFIISGVENTFTSVASDIALMEIDSANGDILSAIHLSNASTNFVYNMTAANEYLYVTGTYALGMDFGDGNLVVPAGGFYMDVFTAKYWYGTLGLTDNQRGNISMYPNPASDRIFVNGQNDFETATFIDLSGKTIRETAVNDNGIDVKGLPTGMYLVRLAGSAGTLVTKILIE